MSDARRRDRGAGPGQKVGDRPGGRGGAELVAAVLLLAVTFALYGRAIGHPFLLDDRHVILGDPRVREGRVWEVLSTEYWPGERGNRVWRPLTLLSLALNWAASTKPHGFRVVNLMLHGAVGLGVFLLARELLRQRLRIVSFWAPLAAGVLFVAHPLHTTPLNQIVDRADILAAGAVVWGAWLYTRFPPGAARPAVELAAAPLVFAAGLLSKENAVVLIPILALLDLTRRTGAQPAAASPRVPSRAGAWAAVLIRRYGLLLVVLFAYLVGRTAVLGGVARPAGAISPLDNIVAQPAYGLRAGESVWLARWGTPLAVFGRAVVLMLWPARLSWDYAYAAIDGVRGWTDGYFLAGVAGLVGCAALIVLSWRRSRYTAAAVGFALIAYSVVSNTFIVIGSAFAERYLYLPLVGFCLLFARVLTWPTLTTRGIRQSWEGLDRRLHKASWQASAGPNLRLAGTAVLAICACLAAAGRTLVRVGDFRSPAELNAADLRSQPRSARLWAACAGDALNTGGFHTALEHAREALRIYPEYDAAWRIAGLSEYALGRPGAALEALRRSFAFGGADHEGARIAAARILHARGDSREAIGLLEPLAVREAASAVVLNNLAWYLLTAQPPEQRDAHRALEYSRRAVAMSPAAGDFLDTYSAALLALGRREEAHRALREGLPRLPTDDPQRAALADRLRDLGGGH
jgi:tetratricopeptide (TPR) repeat protein